MFNFHVDPDLGILFEKFTTQIDTQPGLGTQHCVKAPGKLRVNIVKMQRLTSD